MFTLCTNLKTAKATTQFTNYDFNSFCNFNGMSLAAGDEGLFELGGNLDNGQRIDAYFEPIVSSWGTLNAKHIRYFYVGYECDGELELSLLNQGTKFATYNIPCPIPNTQLKTRITISKDPAQVYWAFGIGNINGSDFSIDEINALFITRNHGFSQSS